MKKLIFSLLMSSVFVSTTFAATIVCPAGSGCDSCFGFTLESTNSTYSVFIPRTGENEFIDTAASSIFAETYQGAGVTPVGNIKSSFTLDAGPSTSSWTWADMNGFLIQKGTIPSSINYSNAVYRIKYTTQSHTLNSSNQKKSGSDATRVACSYFYASAPTSNRINGQCSTLDTYATSNPRNSSLANEDLCDQGTAGIVTYNTSREQWTYICSGSSGGSSDSCIVDLKKGNTTLDGQCSDLDAYATSNPRNSSLSGEDLCDAGSPSSVTYSASREQWTYRCSGRSGGSSDSCIVDLETQIVGGDDCRVEVTDKRGTVPFSTGVLCSGNPSGKTAIVVSQNGKIIDAIDSDSETVDFYDSGIFTISCYPDVVNNRGNICKTTVSVSGDCGNDVEESDEQCDDGNSISGDGCNSSCQTEFDDGAVCGNGIKESREQCDDGNNEDGDDCTSICQNTTPDTGPIATLLALLLLSSGGTGYYLYLRRKNIA